MQVTAVVVPRARVAAAAVERLDRRAVIAAFVVLNWVVTIALAREIRHNGWLFHHGGDGTYYWTTTWSLAHRVLPETVISYGLPVVLWPLGLVFGPNMIAALPAILLLQLAVLAPLGVVAVAGIAERIGGRLFAYLATLMWVLSPVVALHYFQLHFRWVYETFALPGQIGLTNLADYPSMILTLVIGWLVLRAIDDRRWNDVVLGGLVCGFLIAVKPSNAIFVPAPVATFLVVRRWREAVVFVAALVPALLTLTIWKAVGLGQVPLLGATMVGAAGAHGAIVADAWTTRYLPFDWGQFTLNLARMREVGWSLRVVEFIPIAGTIGAWRRGRHYAVLLALWCGAYLIVKGSAKGRSDVYSTTFFRLTMPGFAAFVLLAACIVFCVPGLGREWRARAARAVPLRWTPALVVAVALLAVYPLAVIAVSHPARAQWAAKENAHNLLVPIAGDLHPDATRSGGRTRLRWTPPPTGSTHVSYVVYRGSSDGCTPRASGAKDCDFDLPLAAVTRDTHWTDPRPGRATYRVGLVADPLDRARKGDLLMLSRAVAPR
jgi:hypothetical protein